MDMTAETRTIYQGDIISQAAIMANVSADHQVAIRTDNSVAIGSAVYCDMFTEYVGVADDKAAVPFMKFSILRCAAEDNKTVQCVFLAHLQRPHEFNVRMQDAFGTNIHWT